MRQAEQLAKTDSETISRVDLFYNWLTVSTLMTVVLTKSSWR